MSEIIVKDPRVLGRRAGSYGLREARKTLADSREAALRLLDDAYVKALSEAERRLQEEYRVVVEQVSALRGQLDMEVKNRIADLRRSFMKRVMDEVMERIDLERESEWYREFMERVFEKLSVEADRLGGLIVRVSAKDMQLAREIASRYGELLRLSDKPASITGGAVAYSPTTGTHIDYSIESIISSHATRLQVKIMRAVEEG
ncbi:MAG: hypothetical protein QXS85_04345 [Acidilobaceae archaeon]